MKIEPGQEFHKPSDFDYQAMLDRPLRIIVIAEGYAMVRRKGCIPFVVDLGDIAHWTPAEQRQS